MTDKFDLAITDDGVCEPFIAGRQPGRLLHDLGAMLSLMKPDMLAEPTLDFGAGTGWITEAIARMGQKVTAFDIHEYLEQCVSGRLRADGRIPKDFVRVARGDGHAMPFGKEFGHLLCYDTLHHMHDYAQVFREFARVLLPGGRAIFVEPGARHSKSPETIAFLKVMAHDPTWIERDVVLEEINDHARAAGFEELKIVPLQHPSDLIVFPLTVWSAFRDGHEELRHAVSERLANTNYNERVVFFFDMPR